VKAVEIRVNIAR